MLLGTISREFSSARKARSGSRPKVILRIVKKPELIQTLLAAFNTANEAGTAVSGIIAAGIVPAAIEMMDNLAIQAAEAAVHAGYPNCGGLLLVELDGPIAEVEALMAQVDKICRDHGASEIRVAQSEAERMVVWKGRKAAFAAMGRVSPNYIVQDGVIPRTALPAVLDEIDRMSAETGLRVANVFHAGDGNLHPGPVRSPHSRTGARGGEVRGRHFAVVHRQGRLYHGRAWRRRREETHDAEDVRGAGSANDAARALRVRSAALVKSDQSVSAPALVWRETGRVQRASAGDGGRGGAVLSEIIQPESAQALAKALAEANASQRLVAPRGGGTKAEWGNLGARPDVILSTTSLNRVLEHAWADMTVTVEAGCTVANLQNTARAAWAAARDRSAVAGAGDHRWNSRDK